MPGIASAATAVVIGHVAGGTRTIRVGAGGIMLPNHAPLVIAEQFGTLDVAVSRAASTSASGRAPGTDQLTARALRRDLATRAEELPARRRWSCRPISHRRSRASACAPCPATGSNVPIWILGSSLFGAQLAAALGPAVRVRLALRAR